MDSSTFYSLLKKAEFQPLSPSEVGVDYISNPKDWYHLLGAIHDFTLLLNEGSIKWYTLCRCHLVDENNCTAHEHFHALVNFKTSTMLGFKKRLQRNGLRLNSKTTFKKILCLDHAVGVMRYICCADGQKQTRRDADGLMGAPHTHYSRCVFNREWCHPRGRRCSTTRNAIIAIAAKDLDIDKLGFQLDQLHVYNTCLCARGRLGMEKKAEARRKRREFYLTERGQEVRKQYKEKADMKRRLIEEISSLKLCKKAELQRDSIKKLINML